MCIRRMAQIAVACYFFIFLRRHYPTDTLPDFGLGTHYELQMGLLDRREGLRAQLEYNPDSRRGNHSARFSRIIESSRTDARRARARIHELKVSRQAPLVRPSEPAIKEAEPRRAANPTERKLQAIWESLLVPSPIGLIRTYF